MTRFRTMIRCGAAAAAAGSILAAGVPMAASAASPAILKQGVCSKGSLYKLQVTRESATRLDTAWEVDMNRAGVTWKVLEKHNGVTFVNTTRTTLAGGSFEVNRFVSNLPGVDTIAATATNPATGEVCRATASL